MEQWKARAAASPVIYMQMLNPPAEPAPRPLTDDALVRRIINPTPAFYRHLYTSVGGPWAWMSRSRLPDADLSSCINAVVGEIYVIFVCGVPVGYAEFDLQKLPDVELVYFGLRPEYIGRGLGALLLDWSTREVWRRHAPRRLWLHTRALDHPRAATTYRRAGFIPYEPHENHALSRVWAAGTARVCDG
jgi:GNAT superfamily N-acetyltransferase